MDMMAGQKVGCAHFRNHKEEKIVNKVVGGYDLGSDSVRPTGGPFPCPRRNKDKFAYLMQAFRAEIIPLDF